MLILVMLAFLPSSNIGADSVSTAKACMKCHPRETSNYLASPMGQSLGVPNRAAPSGKVAHAQSGATITVTWRNGQMIHHLSELGLTADYGIQYQIGAGQVGHSYLSVLHGSLLESPVSYYKNFGWDVSPGYANSELLDFDRVLNSRCLFCHSDGVSSSNESKAEDTVTIAAISCDRCHGSTEAHLRRPVAGSVVNPAKLPVNARDSVCEQCHLEGVSRVLNPGKTLRDFLPGNELAGTLAIYIPKEEGASHLAVSQAEQLAMSRCSIASQGKLWCGTCHDPHAEKSGRSVGIKAACSGCHAQLSSANHPVSVKECTSCHMPRMAPRDVAHAATTDHRILAKPQIKTTPALASSRQLKAWREPPPEYSQRDLALAELEAAGKPGYEDLGVRGGKELVAINPEALQDDAQALAALGSVKLSENDPTAAVEFFRRAAQIDPSNPSFALYLGIAAKQKGDVEGAIHALRHSFELNPSLERAYLELVSLYNKIGNPVEAGRVLDQYLKWNKQSILGRMTRESLPPVSKK